MTTSTDPAAQAMPDGRAEIVPVVIDVEPTTTLAVKDWDDAYRALVMRTVLKPKNREATKVELYFFAEQIKRTGLDPFHRQIYAIYRKKKGVEELTIQVGIDGFRLIAERTGKYDGQTEQQWCGPDGVWHTVWTQDGHPFAARCGVYKNGRREPTYAVAHWAEYVQTYDGTPTGKWMPTSKGGMPANQLSKCAEALALRKCFPAELSGLYTPEEMEQADREGLGDGRGSGEPAGLVLGDAIEAVIARAERLGHHALADRGMIEMRVADADGKVIPAKAEKFIREATAELDAIPQDAEVVDGTPDAVIVDRESGAATIVEHKTDADRSDPIPSDVAARQTRTYEALGRDLSRDPVQAGEDEGEAVNAPQEPGAAREAREYAPPTDEEQAAADKLGFTVVSQGFLDDGPPRKAIPTAERIAAMERRAKQLLNDADALDDNDPRRAQECRDEADGLMTAVESAADPAQETLL